MIMRIRGYYNQSVAPSDPLPYQPPDQPHRFYRGLLQRFAELLHGLYMLVTLKPCKSINDITAGNGDTGINTRKVLIDILHSCPRAKRESQPQQHL